MHFYLHPAINGREAWPEGKDQHLLTAAIPGVKSC
jgi:hypothetical protein